MKQYRSLLANRNFLFLWLGGAISNIGDFFNSLALLKILSDDPGHLGFMLALIMIAKMLPAILLSPLAGVLADRISRRSIMIASDLLRAGLVVGLVFTSNPIAIVGLVFAAAAVSAFFNPASSALLPNVVKQEELVTAGSLSFTTQRLAQLLGNGLGAALLLFVGPHQVFYVDATSFIVSALFTAMMVLPAKAPAAVPAATPALAPSRSLFAKFATDLREAMAFMKEVPVVRYLMTGFGIAAIGDSAANILLYTFFTISLGLAAEKMGFVMALFGGASVIGALVIGAVGSKVHWRNLIGYGAVYVWVMAVGMVLAHSVIPSAVFMASLGLGSSATNVGASAAFGTLIPDRVRGRISGAMSMFQSAIYVVGTLLGGWVNDRIGPGPTLLTFTITYLLAGLYCFWAIRPGTVPAAGAEAVGAAAPEPAAAQAD